MRVLVDVLARSTTFHFLRDLVFLFFFAFAVPLSAFVRPDAGGWGPDGAPVFVCLQAGVPSYVQADARACGERHVTRRQSLVCVRVCARAPGPFLCLLAFLLIPNAARRRVGSCRLLNPITFAFLLRFQWPRRRPFCPWWFFVVCVPECRGEAQLTTLRLHNRLHLPANRDRTQLSVLHGCCRPHEAAQGSETCGRSSLACAWFMFLLCY